MLKEALVKMKHKFITFCLLFICLKAMIVHKTWHEQDSCEAALIPKWPFAYSKKIGTNRTIFESYGRNINSTVNFGDICSVEGVKEPCIICRDNQFEIQGVDHALLPKNIPTISDVPWAVNGRHRYEYQGNTEICIFLTSGKCVLPIPQPDFNYSNCITRCWGSNSRNLSFWPEKLYPEDVEYFSLKNDKEMTLQEQDANFIEMNSNGHVATIAGIPKTAGSEDGLFNQNLLNGPTGIEVDADGNLFIVDRGNNCIRRLSNKTKELQTVAGVCETAGFRDGPASVALFNRPFDLSIFYINLENAEFVVLVTDSENHRIRSLSRLDNQKGWDISNVYVETFAGRSSLDVKAGYRDGNLIDTMFSHPTGIDVDLSKPEQLSFVVTDRDNHLIRRVHANGDVTTVAGKLEMLRVDCFHDCYGGVAGVEDGSLSSAKFYFPTSLTVDRRGIIFVGDGNRIRKIDCHDDNVFTLTGSFFAGSTYGFENETLFDNIMGLTTVFGDASRILISDSGNCGVKMLSTTLVSGKHLNCNDFFFKAMDYQNCNSKENLLKLDRISRQVERNIFWYNSNMNHDDLKKINKKAPCESLNSEQLQGFQSVHEKNSFMLKTKDCPQCNGSFFLEEEKICTPKNSTTFLVKLERDHTQNFIGFVPKSINHVRYISSNYIGKVRVETNGEEVCGSEHQKFGNEASAGHVSLSSPIGITMNKYNPRDKLLYLVDSGNNIVRYATPLCSIVCQNEGKCMGIDTCICGGNWSGPDCTQPVCSSLKKHHVCVGPEKPGCLPGWTNFPDCNRAQCVQTCANNGNCFAPDTCSCTKGWFGTNCSMPICSQTCGNGGRCIGPDTCSCSDHWIGSDCRVPVCSTGCQNEGTCVAPDTCFCKHDWTGIDCTLPVCLQGGFQSENHFEIIFVPCFLKQWCEDTNHLHCKQFQKEYSNNSLILDPKNYFSESFNFKASSFATFGDLTCVKLELSENLSVPFPLMKNNSFHTSSWINQPKIVYSKVDDDFSLGDRMIGLAQMRLVPRGRYTCANDGTCVSPNKCKCSEGWIGFDCRIPVCTEGYYMPNTGNGTILIDNIFDASGTKVVNLIPETFKDQGRYQCSKRIVTKWENSKYIHEHPNYYSRFMSTSELDWPTVTYSTELFWPHTHEHTNPEGNYTAEGWRRNGYWKRVEYADPLNRSLWRKGECNVSYERVCNGMSIFSNDTLLSFKPNVIITDKNAVYENVWFEESDTCIDHVHLGCYNNGTCIAPDTCICAEGFTGVDCSIPSCDQQCSRSKDEEGTLSSNGFLVFTKGTGNCTGPNICTCEKGWEGEDCSVPICAQECANDGQCVMPDTCECSRWRSKHFDSRRSGGWPMFQDTEGDPQLTGWTGFDCSTPICTQASTFITNLPNGAVRLGGNELILFGKEPTNNLFLSYGSKPPYLYSTVDPETEQVTYNSWLRKSNLDVWNLYKAEILEHGYALCRKYGNDFCEKKPNELPFEPTWDFGDGEIVRNDGRSFQLGCKRSSSRFSDHSIINGVFQAGYLCEVHLWWQGDYEAGRFIRINNDATAFEMNTEDSFSGWKKNEIILQAEGIYACYNYGSCVSPDVCTCPDGFTGFDCSIPLCRHRQVTGEIVSCLNGGICMNKDECQCPKFLSTLIPSIDVSESIETGYTGTDCSIPICKQGIFDLFCEDVSLGGEGCYRCQNGGLCTAPDVCTCTDDWSGIDCTVPVCKITADLKLVLELQTVYPNKIAMFEEDSCMSYAGQGKCFSPGVCKCTCFEEPSLTDSGEWEYLPWSDPFSRELPIGFVYGSTNCRSGFEGVKDDNDNFRTCHLEIYEPSWFDYYTKTIIWVIAVTSCCCCWGYYESTRKDYQLILMRKAAKKRRLVEEEAVPRKRRRRQKKGNKEKKKRYNKKRA